MARKRSMAQVTKDIKKARQAQNAARNKANQAKAKSGKRGWPKGKKRGSGSAKKAWKTRYELYGPSGRKNGKKAAKPKTAKGRRAAARAKSIKRK